MREINKYKMNIATVKDNCVRWIKEWFNQNGPTCNAIIGISGGKDSTIVAALCAEALGKDRVIGVAMPDYGQGINEADEICKYLGIKYIYAPINGITSGFGRMWQAFGDEDFSWSEQAEQNIPPRIRMTMLYAIAQTYNGRVSCNCNLSEDYIGYSTLFGDNVGSFAPIANLTVSELLELGDYMGIPKKWVHKTPDDGLPHSKSDEEKFGFSYATLDRYITTGECDDPDILKKIETMHNNNIFKLKMINIPTFDVSDSYLDE